MNFDGDGSDGREPKERLQDTQQRQRAIGQEIRRLYNDVVTEAVPRHLLDLLQEIDAQGKSGPHDKR